MSLRFGFIGCGAAARHHADVVRALGHSVWTVAARKGSPRLAPFARDYGAERSYEDFRKMLEAERLDALVVAASWDQTELLAEEVVQSGVPALIEKPAEIGRAHV